MSNGFSELDAQIERLQALEDFPRKAAPDVAEALEDELHAQIKRGEGPDGRPWEPRQEDGEKPLQNAAKALAVVPIGTTVFARLKGPEARHHKGTAKGGTIRRILPVKGIPNPMVRAIKRVLKDRFEQTMEAR